MGSVRILVDDVDEAIAAFEAAGYALVERPGPPFALLSGNGSDLWISGPGSSAARVTAQLPAGEAPRASTRAVLEVDDLDSTIAELLAAGWMHAAGPVSGPGGTQQLLRSGGAYLEIFAAA